MLTSGFPDEEEAMERVVELLTGEGEKEEAGGRRGVGLEEGESRERERLPRGRAEVAILRL